MLRFLRSQTGVLLTLSILVIALGVELRQRSPTPLLGQSTGMDVATWTPIDDSELGGYNFYSVTYDNGRFVAVGVGGAYSTDGVTWFPIPDTVLHHVYKYAPVAYGAGKVV